MSDREQEIEPLAWMLRELVALCDVARECNSRPEEVSPQLWDQCMRVYEAEPREGRRRIKRFLRGLGIDLYSVKR